MVVVGIGIRIILAPLTSYPNDDLPWYSMVVSGMQHLPVYARPGFSYPPLWGWALETMGRLLHAFGATPAALGVHDAVLNRADAITGGALATTITSPLLNLCIKGMLTVADLLTAGFLVALAPTLSNKARAREWAFALYFLNPLVINETAVRAGIDGLVALTIAAALFMLARQRFVLAGATLSIGTFVKLTPLLVAPLVVCVLISSARREGARGIDTSRPAGAFMFGAVVVTGVILLALLVTGQWDGFVENTFSRVQTGLLIGGPAFGGLRHFAVFSGLLAWSATHSGLVLSASALCEAAAVIGMSAWVWRKARSLHTMTVLVVGVTVVIAVVVATTPTSQPGYVLWFLPGLVLLASARPGTYLPFLVVLSVAAVVFSLTYYSPAQVLFPLAEYTRVLSARSLATTVQHWFSRATGLWGSSYKEDFAAPCAAFAMLAYLFLVPQCLEDRVLGAHAPVTSGNARSGGSGRWLAPVAAAVMGLAILVVPNAGPAPPPGSHAARVVGSTFVRNVLAVSLSARPIADERWLRTAIFPVASTPAVRRIDVFVDGSMPLDHTTFEDERGVYDNLRADLSLWGYPRSVTAVDAFELDHVLADRASAADTVVVDTSSVLPSSVLGPTSDSILPWLRAGGVLYWGGGPIGFLHALPGDQSPQVWAGGPELLMGPAAGLPPQPGRQSTSPSRVARALGLQYQDSSFSPWLGAARAEGAVALGFVGPNSSSVTSFNFGAGRLVDFGGLMYENAQVAGDIALLAASGVLYAVGPLRTWTEHLPPNGVRWSLSVGASAGALERVVVFDPRRIGVSFSTFLVEARA